MAKNKCTPFGVQIKMALLEKGMSSKELALRVGYTTSTISDVIYGRNDCMDTHRVIAQELGIQMEHLEV